MKQNKIGFNQRTNKKHKTKVRKMADSRIVAQYRYSVVPQHILLPGALIAVDNSPEVNGTIKRIDPTYLFDSPIYYLPEKLDPLGPWVYLASYHFCRYVSNMPSLLGPSYFDIYIADNGMTMMLNFSGHYGKDSNAYKMLDTQFFWQKYRLLRGEIEYQTKKHKVPAQWETTTKVISTIVGTTETTKEGV